MTSSCGSIPNWKVVVARTTTFASRVVRRHGTLPFMGCQKVKNLYITYLSGSLPGPTKTVLWPEKPHTAMLSLSMIPASHFRSSHRPLKSQSDFIDAYASARRIATGVQERMGIDVFPYSKFYIFFDQYTSIVRLAAALLGSALILVWIVTSIFLGSILTGLVVTLTVLMILIDVMGAMVIAGVSLNAVSLVNLIICIGIGVEFCAHIARAFSFPNCSVLRRAKLQIRGRDARVWAAMVNVGGSVFTGITITKLLGICVLAFTRSKIFEVYYFRIWLALIIFAALHALIFLPVALSLFGGAGMTCSLL